MEANNIKAKAPKRNKTSHLENIVPKLIKAISLIQARRILIVDDEPYNIMGLRVLITASCKFSEIDSIVDQANNGVDALQMIKQA
jgi:two-component SAPR family response regulator